MTWMWSFEIHFLSAWICNKNALNSQSSPIEIYLIRGDPARQTWKLLKRKEMHSNHLNVN